MKKSEFGDEYKRRRDRRNKDTTSLAKLIFRIVLLLALIFLIRFISSGGVERFFDLITGSNQEYSQVIIKEK
ncbi:MAG: hypothetical protein KGY74_04450 [Candidatus Cloacimonetes bacterium]|nr:hypothetical protein [Candidatus Cloacimonadota bacterium]